MGRFINQIDLQRNQRVAVIGSEIAQNLSLLRYPIGEKFVLTISILKLSE